MLCLHISAISSISFSSRSHYGAILQETPGPFVHQQGHDRLAAMAQSADITASRLKESGDALMADALPKGHDITSETASSGTTGRRDRCGSYLMYVAGNAAFERASKWYGGTNSDRSCVVHSPSGMRSLIATFGRGSEGSDRLKGNAASRFLAVNHYWPSEHIIAHGTTRHHLGFPDFR